MDWYEKNDCLIIKVPIKRNKNWSQTFLLTSDIHIDSKKCQTLKLKQHLEEMKERDAYLIDNGDIFDCMGGKYDKRSNKADILTKLQGANYFDLLNDHAVDILGPHADRIIMLADGNHELSVTQRHEIDLIQRLQNTLNRDHGGNIIRQGYAGWIKFEFDEGGNSGKGLIMYRTHGNGGNAPVTKGVIQSARRQDMIDADVYISGHIHTNYTVPRPMWYITRDGVMKIKEKFHHQLGTYKDSSKSTWETMKGFAPPSLGGTWITFRCRTDDRGTYEITVEFTRAW